MENPNKPERKLILGLTPVAFWCLGPLVMLGVGSVFTWLVIKLIEFFR